MYKSQIHISLIALLFAGVLLSGCSRDPQSTHIEYAPQMYHSIPYEPFTQVKGDYSDELFWIWSLIDKGDTLHNLLPPEGTIATDGWGKFEYSTGTDERDRAGKELSNPMTSTDANLKEGKILFNRFCVVCHGKKGLGDGTVPATGKYPRPPSYADKTSAEMPHGAVYHVITLGQNAMGSYASQILPQDRWKIALYVETLQKSGGTVVEDVDDQGDEDENVEDDDSSNGSNEPSEEDSE